MHAASVHPEPGSNSLKNYILNLSHPRLNTFFRANSILSFILLFEFLNVFINENLHCLKSLDLKPSASNFLLFNFQWASAVSRESAYLLYYNLFQLSSGFFKKIEKNSPESTIFLMSASNFTQKTYAHYIYFKKFFIFALKIAFSVRFSS